MGEVPFKGWDMFWGGGREIYAKMQSANGMIFNFLGSEYFLESRRRPMAQLATGLLAHHCEIEVGEPEDHRTSSARSRSLMGTRVTVSECALFTVHCDLPFHGCHRD